MSETEMNYGQSMAERKPLTVGEEFMAWAETYWKIDQLYDFTVKDCSVKRATELMSYKQLKPYFIQEIDFLVENKLRKSGLIR